MTDTELAFGRLDVLLADAGAYLSGLKPISFDVPDAGETWRFDPEATGPRFAKGPASGAPLRVTVSARVLLRIVSEPNAQPDPGEVFQLVGDRAWLERLAEALVSKPQPR